MYVPVAPGVYGISNAREWIYIGAANNLQEALLAHLSDLHTSLMQREPTGFVFEACDAARLPARRDRLILEYVPTCNRQSSRH
jgi:predicted GIY-YIG superfamily endonuclease